MTSDTSRQSTSQLRRSFSIHLAFLVVAAIVPLTLEMTEGISSPAVRWMLVHAPLWIWLAAAVRLSPFGIRVALVAWTAATVGAAALAGPVADLTVVPRVVWIVAEVGLALYYLAALATERGSAPAAAAFELGSDIAVVAAVTSGVTWFFARGAYEASVRLTDAGDLFHLVNGSIGALVGVAVTGVVVRAWFRSVGRAPGLEPALAV